MSGRPEDVPDFPKYMMLDAEREAEEARAAAGYPKPLSLEALATLRECFTRRAREIREQNERLYGETKEGTP